MSGHEHEEPVGSLAEEAARLLGALGDWASHQDPSAEEAHAADTPGEAGTCRWCPVCRAAHAVRHADPEVTEQLVVAADALLRAGRGILASFAATGPGTGRSGSGGVEHIDLDAGWDEDEHDEHDEHDGGGGATGVREDEG